MTDAKSRKVIVLEGTFMPTYVKDAIAQGLFDNLRVGLNYRGNDGSQLIAGALGIIHSGQFTGISS